MFGRDRATNPAVLADMRHTRRPDLPPAVIADRIPQHQHRIDTRPCPMHARAFEPRLDHQFVGTFHDPAPNRPAGRLEGWIGHLLDALHQIGQVFIAGNRIRMDGRHRRDIGQDRGHTLVFEVVLHGGKPGAGGRRRARTFGLSEHRQPLRGVGEIENSHGGGAVKIKPALNPRCAVRHGHDLPGPLKAASMEFAKRVGLKLLGIDQPRHIREVSDRRRLVVVAGFNDANRQGFHLGPDAANQGNHGAVNAHDGGIGTDWYGGPGGLNEDGFGLRHGESCQARRFGQALDGGFTDRHLGKGGEYGGGTGKGEPGTQMGCVRLDAR